jgi:putative hemolysin
MRHRRDETTDARRATPRYIATVAESPDTVLAAQRLRHRVFQSGSSLASDHPDADDRDAFDADCEHLVVLDTASDEVVGTYRMLTAERAIAAGGFYSETEFDLGRLRTLDARIVEVGRACVDPAYRNGRVITLLLSGLTRWVVARGYDFVIGCASIDAATDPTTAARVCRRLLAAHLGPDAWRVFPRVPFQPIEHHEEKEVDVPPLIKAYLHFGAAICGKPAWDPVFGTADLLMMLPMATMAPRFRARLLRDDDAPHGPRPRSRWAA